VGLVFRYTIVRFCKYMEGRRSRWCYSQILHTLQSPNSFMIIIYTSLKLIAMFCFKGLNHVLVFCMHDHFVCPPRWSFCFPPCLFVCLKHVVSCSSVDICVWLLDMYVEYEILYASGLISYKYTLFIQLHVVDV
jgi:hypothetical protein